MKYDIDKIKSDLMSQCPFAKRYDKQASKCQRGMLHPKYTICDGNCSYVVSNIEQMRMKELEKAIKDITELIQPHLIDAFCGYDENSKSFDVVLAIKEILEHKENVDKNIV